MLQMIRRESCHPEMLLLGVSKRGPEHPSTSLVQNTRFAQDHFGTTVSLGFPGTNFPPRILELLATPRILVFWKSFSIFIAHRKAIVRS
jgi:hypothetical protein